MIGDYNGIPAGGGSWNGNRGRQHFDELRMWGNADGQRNWLANAGGGRMINTNPQAQAGNIFLPGDLGMVQNVLTGTVNCNNNSYPFASIYNSSGRIRVGAGIAPGFSSAGTQAGFAVVENNTIVDNQPGIAANLPKLYGATSTTFYIANGATCVVPNTTSGDFNSEPFFGTFNSGTLTAAYYSNFSAQFTVNTGATVTTRVGYFVGDTINSGVISSVATAGAGTVTTQVGLDIAPLVVGGTNIGARFFAGNTTYTTAYPSPIIINPSGTTSTLNFASAGWGNLITVAGTYALQQSANAFGMGGGFYYAPTIKNVNGSTANFTLGSAVSNSPTWQADNATITGSTQLGFSSSPTASVINAGVLSFTGVTHYNVGTFTIGSGVTVTTLRSLNIVDATNSGTLTTQVGVDIAAMTAGTTNIGIRNLSSLLQKGAMVATPNTVSVSSNAGHVLVTSYLSNFTNSSAANMTITMDTSGASDGQVSIVRIYDATNVAKGITWVNTEISAVTPVGTSNGSTTLPVTVAFIYNGQTSAWRCVASV